MDNDDFLKLQQKWYDKLKSDGFKDIEGGKAGCQDTRFLVDHSLMKLKKFDYSTYEHFRRCRIHCQNFKFGSDIDKKIFEWYAEGLSFRAITAKYNELLGADRSLTWVYKQIDRMRQQMDKAKLWNFNNLTDDEDKLHEIAELYAGIMNKPNS